MAQSIFPRLITSVFEPSFWKSTETALTQANADLRYVKFPIAQGSEIFPSNLTVSGTTSLGQTTISDTTLVITDGTTTNTMNKNGYTTKNTVQNATHYLNFSDSSATGIGAIQKSANFTVNPSTGALATVILTTTSDSTFNGVRVGRGAGNQSSNVAIGNNNFSSNVSGIQNIAIGTSALLSNDANSNIAIGSSSLSSNTSGFQNIGIGILANNGSSGSNNVALSTSSLGSLTTGSNNIAIGASSGTDAVASLTTQSNYCVMGNNSTTNANIKVAWTVTSDLRDKIHFSPVMLGIDFVNQLKPTQFKYRKSRDSDEVDDDVNFRYGFLAQDILAIEGDNPVIIDNRDEENLKYNESSLIPVLVKAIQDQQSIISKLEARLTALENK